MPSLLCFLVPFWSNQGSPQVTADPVSCISPCPRSPHSILILLLNILTVHHAAPLL